MPQPQQSQASPGGSPGFIKFMNERAAHEKEEERVRLSMGKDWRVIRNWQRVVPRYYYHAFELDFCGIVALFHYSFTHRRCLFDPIICQVPELTKSDGICEACGNPLMLARTVSHLWLPWFEPCSLCQSAQASPSTNLCIWDLSQKRDIVAMPYSEACRPLLSRVEKILMTLHSRRAG